jgi:hypothetical protein
MKKFNTTKMSLAVDVGLQYRALAENIFHSEKKRKVITMVLLKQVHEASHTQSFSHGKPIWTRETRLLKYAFINPELT